MSDVPAFDHQQEPRIRWIPLMMSVGLVLVSLTIVAVHQLRDTEPTAIGVERIDNVGTVIIDRTDDGTFVIRDAAAQTVLASYAPAPNQFMAGALRSLDRMLGGPGASLGRELHILRVGVGIVLLEDAQTGDRISLNAFNRSASLGLAEQVAQSNGGTK